MPNTSFIDFSSREALIYILLSIGCVTCAALAAGMTVGLLSLDSLKLQIKLQVGTDAEKNAAQKIIPIIKNHHLLLCTLLLYNALANEALPIFLDALVPSYVAVIISVTLVLICGEVIPSALFTGPDQLMIASKFTGLVCFLEFIFYPIAFPMGKLLDYVLGHEDDDNFNRDEISALVKIMRSKGSNQIKEYLKELGSGAVRPSQFDQSYQSINSILNSIQSQQGLLAAANPHLGDDSYSMASAAAVANNTNINRDEILTSHEVNVITGVLGLTKILVRDICIPIPKVVMLSSDQILDLETMDVIDKVGFSRLPVFLGGDSTNIIGYLIVKRLIKINPEHGIPLSSIPLTKPVVVGANKTLLDILKIFQSGSRHMAIVSENPKELKRSIAQNTKPPPSAEPIG